MKKEELIRGGKQIDRVIYHYALPKREAEVFDTRLDACCPPRLNFSNPMDKKSLLEALNHLEKPYLIIDSTRELCLSKS